jgi:hypothetical protein
MRASEDFLAQLHQEVARRLHEMIGSEDPREAQAALSQAIKFLKDNAITATVENKDLETLSESTREKLPTMEELERMMQLTPD